MAQQINLFSPVFLRKRKHFSAATMLQALGLLLAGVLVFYGYTLVKARELERVAADSAKQAKEQSEQVAALTRQYSPQGRSRLLEEEVSRAEVRLKQRQDLLDTLKTGGLGNTEGFARYLTAFARHPMNGVWLTGFSIGGDEALLQLNGRVLHADLVPAYLRALNQEAVMRGRRVSELRLTAREEREPAPTAAPGAAPAPAPAATRYVEFALTASRAPEPRPAEGGAAK